jgi:hypothetical protein
MAFPYNLRVDGPGLLGDSSEQRPVLSAGNDPHFDPGERIDLLFGTVRRSFDKIPAKTVKVVR